MIVWINGTFGAGKTTTAAALVELLPDARVFDAEEVGFMLRRIPNLPALGDFQHWPPWRALVVETARAVLDYVGGTLVIPQTVLVQHYWTEIRTGLGAAHIPVHHFLLHADQPALACRIEQDTASNRHWRLDHLSQYQDALSWLVHDAVVIDTTRLVPHDVATMIAAACEPSPRSS